MGKTDRLEVAVSPKQIVFLTMIAAMAAVAAFLFGVQVGRGVGAREAVGGGAVPAFAPLDHTGGGARAAPPEGGDPAGSGLDGLSYFERLRGAGPVAETLDFGVEPRAGAEAPAAFAPLVDAPAGSFLVEVMSVSGAAAARDVKAGLEAKGYPVVVEPMRAPGALHRVRVGPFADRAEAERVGRRLRTGERFEPWVTQP